MYHLTEIIGIREISKTGKYESYVIIILRY